MPLKLRLISDSGRTPPTELDAPPEVAGWSASLGGRLHAGLFRVTRVEEGAAGGPHYHLVSAADGARRLERADAHAPGGWAPGFHAGVLARAAARDAPVAARGFAVRPRTHSLHACIHQRFSADSRASLRRAAPGAA